MRQFKSYSYSNKEITGIKYVWSDLLGNTLEEEFWYDPEFGKPKIEPKQDEWELVRSVIISPEDCFFGFL